MLARYVGNCVNSFDGLGDCVLHELPWYDVSAFACAEESASEINEVEFYQSVSPFPDLPVKNASSISYLRTEDGVFMLYDREADIHYFFA